MNAQTSYLPLSHIPQSICVFVFFSHWFEVGGAHLVKGDVTLQSRSEYSLSCARVIKLHSDVGVVKSYC